MARTAPSGKGQSQGIPWRAAQHLLVALWMKHSGPGACLRGGVGGDAAAFTPKLNENTEQKIPVSTVVLINCITLRVERCAMAWQVAATATVLLTSLLLSTCEAGPVPPPNTLLSTDGTNFFLQAALFGPKQPSFGSPARGNLHWAGPGCGVEQFRNATSTGFIAVVERGQCRFVPCFQCLDAVLMMRFAVLQQKMLQQRKLGLQQSW